MGGPYGLRHLRVRNHMVSRLDSESGPPGRQSAITDILDFERSSWTRRSPGQEDDNCGGVSPDRICFLAPGAATICATGRAIAELMVARYRDVQSLDHQAEAIAATGLRLTRTELAKWAIRAADMLAPTAEAIRAVGLESPVIAAANRSVGLNERMRLWAYCTDGRGDRAAGHRRAAWFRVTPDRHGGYAAQELAGFQGVLLASFADGYDAVLRSGTVVAAACWGQIRLMARAIDPYATQAACAEVPHAANRLVAIEADLADASLAARVRLRRERATPILQELESALRQAERDAVPGSDVARFAAELRAQWPALTAFLHDGRLELENKSARIMLDRLANRDHWVPRRFNGLHLCVANMATIIETCSLNGVDPRDYIAWILGFSAAADPQVCRDRLMPWDFALAASPGSISANTGCISITPA